MPIFEYENEASGEVVEQFYWPGKAPDSLTIDGKRMRRLTAPSRLSISRGVLGPLDSGSFEADVRKGYRDLAASGKARRGNGHFGLNKVKKIWGF